MNKNEKIMSKNIINSIYKWYILITFFLLCTFLTTYNLIVTLFLSERISRRVWFRSSRVLCKVVFKLGDINIHVEGFEHVPSETAIFAADHRSLTDSLVMLVLMKRYFFTLTAPLEYFPWLYFRMWIRRMGFISIFRYKIDESKFKKSVIKSQAVFETIKRIKEKDSMIIYPEGHHEKKHKLARFHTGAVRFALNAKVPIIPVAIIGSDVIISKVKHKLHSGTVHVKFGRPIYYDEYFGKEKDHKLIRKLTSDLRKQVNYLMHHKI